MKIKNTLEIMLHNAFHSGNEKLAIEIVNSNPNIDVNYNFKERIPIFSAFKKNMINLAEVIINHPKWDYALEDFGESFFHVLIYIYDCNNESYLDGVIKKLIKSILKKNISLILNHTDINEDTVLNVVCQSSSKTLWVAKELIKLDCVDVNIVNDANCTALTNAIKNKNIEMIKLLAKRKDLVVRDFDKETAENIGINLKEYLK